MSASSKPSAPVEPGGQNPAIEQLSFEEAMKELEQIVRRLENGNAPLDEAIAIYERGAALKAHCEKKLGEARSRIERITMTPTGDIATKEFDAE